MNIRAATQDQHDLNDDLIQLSWTRELGPGFFFIYASEVVLEAHKLQPFILPKAAAACPYRCDKWLYGTSKICCTCHLKLKNTI
jgi:hypothetical protein